MLVEAIYNFIFGRVWQNKTQSKGCRCAIIINLTDSWQFDDCLNQYLMTAWKLSDDCLNSIWWLPWLMPDIMWWLLHNNKVAETVKIIDNDNRLQRQKFRVLHSCQLLHIDINFEATCISIFPFLEYSSLLQ